LLFLILSFTLSNALKSKMKALLSVATAAKDSNDDHDDDDHDDPKDRDRVYTEVSNILHRPPKGCAYLYTDCNETDSLKGQGIFKVCKTTHLNSIPKNMEKNLSGIRCGPDTRIVLQNKVPELNIKPQVVTNKDGFFSLCSSKLGGNKGPWNDKIADVFLEDETPKPQACAPTLLADAPEQENNSFMLYRFNNGVDHFYTQYPEKEDLTGYNAEGTAGKCHKVQKEGTLPFHRYFNGRDHLYTTDEAEIGTIVANGIAGKDGYKYQGIACYIYQNSKAQKSLKPLYRYWNGIDHFYTLKVGEVGSRTLNKVGKNGYEYEGIAGYIWADHNGGNDDIDDDSDDVLDGK
jgi:hypothetical protein